MPAFCVSLGEEYALLPGVASFEVDGHRPLAEPESRRDRVRDPRDRREVVVAKLFVDTTGAPTLRCRQLGAPVVERQRPAWKSVVPTC